MISVKVCDLLRVKEWSHQSVLHNHAFKSSAVRLTMAAGGATKVLITKSAVNIATMIPRRFIKSRSVILIALAERTRNITEILRNTKCINLLSLTFLLAIYLWITMSLQNNYFIFSTRWFQSMGLCNKESLNNTYIYYDA